MLAAATDGHHSNFVKLLSSTQLFGLANRKKKENNFLHARTKNHIVHFPTGCWLHMLFLLGYINTGLIQYVNSEKNVKDITSSLNVLFFIKFFKLHYFLQ